MRKLVQMVLLAAVLASPVIAAVEGREASASVAYDSAYSFEQAFGSAMRLVRVDLGCKITEKDEANGYLLFDYTSPESGKRVHKGSVEVVRKGQGSHVAVQLQSLPRYHEQMIIDALSRKLLAEHGEPPKVKTAPPPPAADVDAGADAGR